MRTYLFGPVAACIVFLSIGSQAWAAPPIEASGIYSITSHTQTLVRMADGNVTFAAVDNVVDTGAIVGTPVDTYTFTIHPNGTVTGQGVETCAACTIGGRTGSYSAPFSFTGTADFSQIDGHFAFSSAAGGLAGLHGEGTFTTGPISLSYHFEP